MSQFAVPIAVPPRPAMFGESKGKSLTWPAASGSCATVPSKNAKIRMGTKGASESFIRKSSLATQHGFPTPFDINSPVIREQEVESFPSTDREKSSCVAEMVASQGSVLPPCDGGRQAWFFLLGAVMIEGLMWGFPLTYGVFQTYYQSHPPFENDKYLPIVGTLATGISYLGTLLVTPFTIKYPKYQHHMIWCGWLFCILALVASSFSTKLWHLIITQGLCYGLGFLVVYYPLLSMLNEWFVERRGLAYGLLFGSASTCGLALPFAIERLLTKYGYAMTLRGYAIAILVLVGPTLPLLKSRLQPKIMDAKETKCDTSVFRKTTFTAATFSNIFQGLVFFLPGIYIPTYASDIGLTTTQGALILSLMNLAQVAGQVAMGLLSDAYDAHIPMFFSTFFSALVIFLLWGFSKSLAPLLIFSILYGLLAGGYSVLYCRFATALSDERATGLWLYSIFEFQRGAGNILGGFVSGLLVKDSVDILGYGVEKYEGIVLLVGLGMLVSSVGGVGWFFRGRCFNFEYLFKKHVWPRLHRGSLVKGWK